MSAASPEPVVNSQPEAPSNWIDQKIQDRNTLLRNLIADDRWALAAYERADDLALLRRVGKAPILDAYYLAIERALMRGHSTSAIAKTLRLTPAELAPTIAGIYAGAHPRQSVTR